MHAQTPREPLKVGTRYQFINFLERWVHFVPVDSAATVAHDVTIMFIVSTNQCVLCLPDAVGTSGFGKQLCISCEFF